MMFRRSYELVSIFILTGLFCSLGVIGEENVDAGSALSVPSTETAGELSRMSYGKFPLIFEENRGQTDAAVKFVSRGPGYTAYLAEGEAVFSLKVPNTSEIANPKLRDKRDTAKGKTTTETLRMRFVSANANAAISGEDKVATRTNYYIDKKRFENLSNYGRVNYAGLYDGIDAVFYGNKDNQLEYDLNVAPNADPNQVRLRFDGATSLSIDEAGNLIAKTANTMLVQQPPVAYQEIDAQRQRVEVAYHVNENNEVVFSLGKYDSSIPLVIDPALAYLTYIGGTAFDQVFEVAADAQLNAYITGTTASLDFHGETRSDSDGTGVFAAKINPEGTQFVYITILEGNGGDFGFGIAVDSNNNAYLSGTASRSFPTTSGAYDTVHGIINGNDGFVTKLNASGNIAYSSFLGGTESDEAFDVAVDGGGKAYVVGTTRSSTGFPKKNEFAGCGFGFPMSTNSFDGFLTVFNSAGSDITYSTCFGGGGIVGVADDDAFSVAVDSSGNAYVTGSTEADNFETKNAAQPTIGGGTDAYVVKFNPASSGDASLIYSTFLGGSGTDRGFSIAVSPTGVASLTGITGSLNFPLQNAIDSTNQINEAFVAQYSANGAKLNSTFLGGSDQDQGLSIALGNGGTIWITGNTLSNNFPMATPFQATRRGSRDAFVAKIRFGINNNPGVSSSSYLGGSGLEEGNGIAVRGPFVFVGGETQSNNLLTTSGVIKQTSDASASNPDGWVAKILDSRKETIGTFDPVNTEFDLRNTLSSGPADIVVNRGNLGDVGVAGDTNGDGIDTVSTFNNGTWRIQNINNIVSGYPTGGIVANFGLPGDLPVIGDWDGDGVETIGVYRPSVGQFFLSNSITTPAINFQITFGIAEDLPIAGDWDGDGIETIGVFRPSVGQFFLTNENIANPPIDAVAFFGISGDLPLGGDWDGDGKDSIGVWRPSSLEFFLSNDNINIANQFVFGSLGDTPVVGDWDGKPNQ